MTRIYTNADAAELLLVELSSAGIISESTVKLHNAKELFESKQENTSSRYVFPNGKEITWDEFKEVYLNYHQFPTRDKVMAHFGITAELYINQGHTEEAFNKASNRLLEHWTKFRNEDALKLAKQFGGNRLPNWKSRKNAIFNLEARTGDGDMSASLDDIDYGRKGAQKKGTRAITMLNGQSVVPGTFYNDISRIPKHRYTGWLKLWERIVNSAKITKYFGKKWSKTFIMGYAIARNSVIEIWYNSATSNFSIHDYNGIELGRPSATLQEATRLFVTFLLQEYETDKEVFSGNKNVVASSYMNALNQAVSKDAIEVARQKELEAAEARREQGQPMKSGQAVRDNVKARIKAAAQKFAGDSPEKVDTAFAKAKAKFQNKKNNWEEVDPEEFGNVFNTKRKAPGSAYTNFEDEPLEGEYIPPGSQSGKKQGPDSDYRPNWSWGGRPDGDFGGSGSVPPNKPSGGSGGSGEDVVHVLPYRPSAIILPDLTPKPKPSFDGLNDYERQYANQLYQRYVRLAAKIKSEVAEIEREDNAIHALKANDNAGPRTKRLTNEKIKRNQARRGHVELSVDEMVQLQMDLEIVKAKDEEGRRKAKEEDDKYEVAHKIKIESPKKLSPATPKKPRKPRAPKKKLDEAFDITKYRGEASVVSMTANNMDRSAISHRSMMPSNNIDVNVQQFEFNDMAAKELDNAAVARRKQAQNSGFTTSAIRTSVIEELITTYDRTRAGEQLKSPGRFANKLLGDKKANFIRKFIKKMTFGREQGIELPTDKPIWYDRMLMVVYGVVYRADFVIGFSLKDQINIEIWYVTEPDPFNKGKNISSYYVYDVTAGLVVRGNLPYYRNAIQTVLAKIGVN